MKLFKRQPRQKPKIKVRKEDIPFLLAKYQYHEGRSQNSVTLAITFTFLLITVAGIGFSIATVVPSFSFSSFILPLLIFFLSAFFIYFAAFIYHSRKSLRIAGVLEIDKRLERYLKKK